MENYTSNSDKLLKILFSLLFKDNNNPFRPYSYQQRIAEAIYFKKHKRIIITASTRAGKTLILALTSILFALKYAGSRIRIIAPIYQQAKIMMNYILEHLTDHPLIIQNLTYTREELMKKERSKERIVFKNGSEIMILSAKGDAERLMGFGGDLIIVDESALIDDEVFRTKIMRMLGDNPESILVEIGNPLKLNHFYEDWHNPNFYKIHIGWEECVREGRLSMEFINEQKEKLTDAEFTMLYEARFVEDYEGSLIQLSKIEEAINKGLDMNEKTWYECGVDVARYGKDFTVITIVKTDGEVYRVEEIKVLKQSKTTEITGNIIELNRKYNFELVKVDDIGVGGGVVDELREAGLPVYPFIASQNPTDKTRFFNLKSETAFNLRELFLKGKISIPKKTELINELRKWEYEFTSNGKIKLIDPSGKSPDFADSLLIAIYQSKQYYFTKGIMLY